MIFENIDIQVGDLIVPEFKRPRLVLSVEGSRYRYYSFDLLKHFHTDFQYISRSQQTIYKMIHNRETTKNNK